MFHVFIYSEEHSRKTASIKRFIAQACKISGLKSARRLHAWKQSIFQVL